ncbi:hypothetical protein GTH32_14240 [Alteromonas sp. 345S023]|uniref:Protein nucleotidyltransferase YdiU n=1 Tax=Alteromonas profundi TaxID=2696062 RepID=A0A7X5LN11_9ALTE|nr:protein adenylyltransferase SelO family protein [Alteromonas profundi]NDV92338.1 hypothetical protein [Alteromonas profundi]
MANNTSNLDNNQDTGREVKTLNDLAECVDYSFINTLSADPNATASGDDHNPRQVFSGHYVPVKPTPIENPVYIAHSNTFFNEIGFDDALAHTPAFMRLFSGDTTNLPSPMLNYGWATGYALSIYGTEYTQQCPFQTGNGYGDGRAISVLEANLNGKHWEMQLKGAGRTPYCRGADGRAVLRSSVREFLVQEHMHALGVPTSRSLSLFTSSSQTVDRPWYREGSCSQDPDVMVPNLVAISTRVAPSFIRVGQLELFARRARCNEHPNALRELEALVAHLIKREYEDQIDKTQPFEKQLLALAIAFRGRLTSLVANWIRVGYCQGNFNSDNCACGGFTLDYGPFGFCELFDPAFQPWTGGGRHFSFLNQPAAAQKNFEMFCRSLQPLLTNAPEVLSQLDAVCNDFVVVMEQEMASMWKAKLGLSHYDHDLLMQLLQLMVQTRVDYSLFFRKLCDLPTDISGVDKCFYNPPNRSQIERWNTWFSRWTSLLEESGNVEEVKSKMKRVNPKFTWREWHIVPAYRQAQQGEFSLIHELQSVLTKPYDEQSEDTERKYCQPRPKEYFCAGGISHYSCSS